MKVETHYGWSANNKIKHARTSNFKKANLKNAFNALGALLIVNLYYYKLEKEKETGEDVYWKEVTNELNAGDNFMKLNDRYYSKAMHFN